MKPVMGIFDQSFKIGDEISVHVDGRWDRCEVVAIPVESSDPRIRCQFWKLKLLGEGEIIYCWKAENIRA